MDELNKSIDQLVDELFSEPVVKSEDLNVARASKTTADAVMAEVPGSESDESRGAGRPADDHDVPKTDEDGNKAKGYEAVQKDQAEEENEEAKKQAKAVTQISTEGRLSQGPKSSNDPRGPMFKAEEYAEYQALKKAKSEADAKAAQEELKKSETLKKAEQANLIKSAVTEALSSVRKENEDIRKAFNEQSAILKAMASQPRQAKSVTSIDALEKSSADVVREAGEFSKSEKLDAAEALYKAGKISMDAVIELENTNNVANPAVRQMIEKQLLG